MVYLDMNSSLINHKKTVNVIFSFSFMISFPFIVLIFPIIKILFGLIFFPFSLVHEIGHFITSILLLPSHEPILHFQIIEGELSCSCEMSHQLLCCLNSIIVIFGGTGAVLFLSIFLLILLSKSKNQTIRNLGTLFLLFGLLSDLPNLFPILPSAIRSPTDGYIIYSFLSHMGFLPILSSGVSYFFSLSSFIIVLISFYFLGSFIFQFITLILERISKSKTTEEEKIQV